MGLVIAGNVNHADLDRTNQDFGKRQTSADGDRNITAKHYATLQDAFNYFDSRLFDDALPQVLITLQRHPRALGYFSAERFQRRGEGTGRTHEIALNPDEFPGRSDEEILSVLVHEMVHLAQHVLGHPGRRRYHNREWARAMYTIGLMPSATGKPGGKPTGEFVSHYIIDGGHFQIECRRFLADHELMWESTTEPAAEGSEAEGDERSGTDADRTSSGRSTRSRMTRSKVKYSCPNNHRLNVWAKPGALVDCHLCSRETGELVLLVSEFELAEENARRKERAANDGLVVKRHD